MQNPEEDRIIQKEVSLREWFTRDCNSVMKAIDGLDIGWSGLQRWVTAHLPLNVGLHLDIACGYGTFLAQLGWRFPRLALVGLNIDFEGPHKIISDLLEKAGVQASLVQADARQMPYVDSVFDSASCFLGLQDIRIGFHKAGVKRSMQEAARVLKPDGILAVIDEIDVTVDKTLFDIITKMEYVLDVQWDRAVAEKAIELYAQGWVAQTRPRRKKPVVHSYEQVYQRMKSNMNKQFAEQGFYVPFGPIYVHVMKKR